jgi:CHAT domain-containing protein
MLTTDIARLEEGSPSWLRRPDVSLRSLPWLRMLGFAALALWLGSILSPQPGGLGPRYRSELAAAVDPSAPLAGRLQGFPHRSPRAASAQPQDLSRLARAIARELREHPSPRARAAMALLSLSAGRSAEAVPLLESAAAVASAERAGFLNDLAVAYLARADSLGKPRDLARALDVASQAAEMDPARPEACFNRALALERLELATQAVAAWEACARREADPEWKSEIERHLARLQPPVDAGRTAHGSAEGGVGAAPTTDLKPAREGALERLLPRWGTAYLNGRTAEAETAADGGLRLGRMLAERDGDSTVTEVFERIVRDGGQPDGGARLAALAQGARLYQRAKRDLAAYKVDSSQREYEQARELFARAGSPLRAWAELGAIGGDFYHDEFARVQARLLALRPEIDEERHPALAAQWYWTRGMAHSRGGDLRAALRDFEATVAFFARTAERENQGAGHQLVGEMYRLLGDEDEAWSHRMRGLVLLRGTPGSRRRLLLLRDAVESLLAEDRNHAALAFQDEAVAVSAPSSPARDLAEMLLWRARAKTRLGRFDGAWADLQEARRLTAQVDSSELQDRALADVGFAEADLEAQSNPSRALAFFEAPEAAYRKKGHILPLATLLLHRARVERVLRRADRELADLAAGIDLFEQQWQSLDAEKDRVSFLETAQELYDARIALEIERGDPVAALEQAERSRAFWTGSPGSLDTSWLRPLAAAAPRGGACTAATWGTLPADLAILEYALNRDRLFVWLLRCDGVRFFAVPVSESRVTELAARFRQSAQGSAETGAETFTAAAEAAYDLLLRKFAGDIPTGAKLALVPDKALYAVPFAALRDRGRFLIEDHELAFAPSATFLASAYRRPIRPEVRRDDVLLVSPFDPGLKESRAEIADLQALYPGAESLTGPDARRDKLLARLDEHRILHYAGHAEVHPSDPMLSRLPLTAAGGAEALSMRDLVGRSFGRLQLVVLSACGSLRAAPMRSGGFLGLARPFLSGGARAVVGTLWDVDDPASRAALVAFHRELRDGATPAAALRAAQIQIFRQGSPASDWAAFAVVGAGSS